MCLHNSRPRHIFWDQMSQISQVSQIWFTQICFLFVTVQTCANLDLISIWIRPKHQISWCQCYRQLHLKLFKTPIANQDYCQKSHKLWTASKIQTSNKTDLNSLKLHKHSVDSRETTCNLCWAICIVSFVYFKHKKKLEEISE